MKAIILEHPLLMHKLSILRNKKTGTKEFREVAGEISSILCYEATRDARLSDFEVETPIQSTIPTPTDAPVEIQNQQITPQSIIAQSNIRTINIAPAPTQMPVQQGVSFTEYVHNEIQEQKRLLKPHKAPKRME